MRGTLDKDRQTDTYLDRHAYTHGFTYIHTSRDIPNLHAAKCSVKYIVDIAAIAVDGVVIN